MATDSEDPVACRFGAGWTFFLCPLLLSGCVSAGSAPPQALPSPQGDFVAFACAETQDGSQTQEEYQRSAELVGRAITPAAAVDHISVHRVASEVPEASHGQPCSAAANRAECETLVKNLAAQTPADTIARKLYQTPYFVTTSGDQVALWAPAEFARLLTPIDTPWEAWYMMRTQVDVALPHCGDTVTSAYRLAAGGYDIRLQRATRACHPLEITEATYRIMRDGRVQTLSEHVVSSDADRCVVD